MSNIPDIEDIGRELDPEVDAGVTAVDEEFDRTAARPTNQEEYEARQGLEPTVDDLY